VSSQASRVPEGYVGLITRLVATGIDALVINLIAVVTGALINLVASILGKQNGLTSAEAVVGAIAWWLWVTAYFVSFWTLTGQTIGCRVMAIRVENAAGGGIRWPQSLRRFAGCVLAALPLGAGFLLTLVDDRRRGLQDRIGGTVVRWQPEPAYELSDPVVVGVAVPVAVPARAPSPPPHGASPESASRPPHGASPESASLPPVVPASAPMTIEPPPTA
jgi:uncharacterized RDD family membrane protein YckC